MSLVIFYTSTRLRVFLQEILFFVLISWFGVCLFKVPETESKQVEPCDLWLTEYFFANKCVMTTNWKQPASVLRSPFALPARIVASIVESRGLPWRGKLLFDLTSQLPAKLQSSTSASSTLQHKQSHTLCLSEKANMNHGEEITTLFGLSFLAADGIPIMSPWKSWSFLSDHLRADNSVHQQHLLPQSPPSVLAALGFYSRNFLHHILSPRKGMVGVSAGQWAHSAYQLMLRPCSFSVATFQLSALWIEPMMWQNLESPSAEGLFPGRVRQAGCLGQLMPFWDLVYSTAVVLSSAINAPAQKGAQTLLAAPHQCKFSPGIVLSTAAQDF